MSCRRLWSLPCDTKRATFPFPTAQATPIALLSSGSDWAPAWALDHACQPDRNSHCRCHSFGASSWACTCLRFGLAFRLDLILDLVLGLDFLRCGAAAWQGNAALELLRGERFPVFCDGLSRLREPLLFSPFSTESTGPHRSGGRCRFSCPSIWTHHAIIVFARWLVKSRLRSIHVQAVRRVDLCPRGASASTLCVFRQAAFGPSLVAQTCNFAASSPMISHACAVVEAQLAIAFDHRGKRWRSD